MRKSQVKALEQAKRDLASSATKFRNRPRDADAQLAARRAAAVLDAAKRNATPEERQAAGL